MVSPKILVVDDSPAIQNLIRRFFRIKKNYQVQLAHDGKTALELFEQFNPDLVILKENLPDAQSYNLCQEMQCRTDVVVLLLTSQEATDQDRGFKQLSVDYLTTPFKLQELEKRVEALLRRM
jgi:DNA-binding response OmpR family regulator